MLNWLEILLRGLTLAISAVALIGCGQPGALYLPSDPAAVNRATLPQSLRPGSRANTATPALPPSSEPKPTP